MEALEFSASGVVSGLCDDANGVRELRFSRVSAVLSLGSGAQDFQGRGV